MISTAKQEWSQVEHLMPDYWVTMFEFADSIGVSHMKVIHALMYARTHGLVEEKTVKRIGHKGNTIRSSVYRKKNRLLNF